MDPGDVLATARHRAADAEAEGGQHLLKRPAVAVQHDARAHAHHAQRRAACAFCASASHSTHTCARKSRPARRLLVERLFAVGAVVADAEELTACVADLPPGAGPRAGCACPSRGSRGSPAWPARSSVGRCSRPPGGRPRRGRRAPLPAPVRPSGPMRAPAAARRRHAAGSAALARGRARARVTCAPALCSAATTGGPIRPVAPVTVTRRAVPGGWLTAVLPSSASAYRPGRSRPHGPRAPRPSRAPRRPPPPPPPAPRRG